MDRKWHITNKEALKKCIEEVITRIEDIDGAEVGIIAAQDVIDIVAENLGPEIYNKAIGDVRKILQDRLHDIEVDIELLQL